MFSICEVDSSVTETRAVFSFKSKQVTRKLIYEMPNKWISAIDDQESEWDPAKGIAFLFLLERPYGELLELLKHAEKSVDQGVIVTSFPSNGIVLMALNNSGEYWIDLASPSKINASIHETILSAQA